MTSDAKKYILRFFSQLSNSPSFLLTTIPTLTHFLFQTCELEFGSWSYDVTQLDISFWIPAESNIPSPYVDFSDYVESNEWYTDGQYERFVNHTSRRLQIRSVKNFRKVSYMQINGKRSNRSYPTLRYLVRLRRNPSFYVSILVIPCILLSSLTLVLFWLPPESPAKLMLGKRINVTFTIENWDREYWRLL